MTRALIVAAILAMSGGVVSAASLASDNASNYTDSNWGLTAPNLGSGFGSWASYLTDNNQPPYAGTFLDTSDKILTANKSWGVYANTPLNGAVPKVDLVREFAPAAGGYSDPSSLGTLYSQTFSVTMASDGVGTSNDKAFGFSLDSGQGAGATANSALILEYPGGGTDNLTLSDNDGTDITNVPINFADLNNGIVITVQVGANPDGLNAYTLTISPAPGNASFNTPYVYSHFTNGPLQQVDMFDLNTDGNGYFNDLSISAEVPPTVPVPAAAGAIGLGMTLLAGARKMKWI